MGLPMADYRSIPAISRLRDGAEYRRLESEFGARETIRAFRDAVEAVRRVIGVRGPADQPPRSEEIEASAEALLRERFTYRLRRVINASGVLLHTNLGRAPLCEQAIEHVVDVCRGYCNIEYDLDEGDRGHRDRLLDDVLCSLTGAERCTVTNNNAGAILLILAALTVSKEVLVSRGELVEIGGGFRVPEIMSQSGATLVEVGTTNRTRVQDFEAGVSARTAAILRVHPSNFRVEGFAERPPLTDLVRLANARNIILIEDIGSGYLGTCPSSDLHRYEPSVPDSIAAGVHICCFSGDKLFGGPQGGIIAGRRELVERISRHPLMRAFRADKLTYAALEATALEYRRGCAVNVPVQRMLQQSPESVRRRVAHLCARLHAIGSWSAEIRQDVSTIGGGSAPGLIVPTWVLSVRHGSLSVHDVCARLRRNTPPIIARASHDQVVLDLRTVAVADDVQLEQALANLALSLAHDGGVNLHSERGGAHVA